MIYFYKFVGIYIYLSLYKLVNLYPATLIYGVFIIFNLWKLSFTIVEQLTGMVSNMIQILLKVYIPQ